MVRAVEAQKAGKGTIFTLHSTKEVSFGLLKLPQKTALPAHNRPVLERLIQVQGKCMMKLMKNGKVSKEIVMKEGSVLRIPRNQYHIHTNPFNEVSITVWKFDGDITKTISRIRKNFEKVKFDSPK